MMEQDSKHGGIDMCKNTVTINHSHGKVVIAFANMKTKHKPLDTTLELELDTDIEMMQFWNVNNFYKADINVKVQWLISKPNTYMIKVMTQKVMNSISMLSSNHWQNSDLFKISCISSV